MRKKREKNCRKKLQKYRENTKTHTHTNKNTYHSINLLLGTVLEPQCHDSVREEVVCGGHGKAGEVRLECCHQEGLLLPLQLTQELLINLDVPLQQHYLSVGGM